jgi:hypothetical protein
VANETIDLAGVGPIGFRRDEPKAATGDELLSDAGPHPIELGRSVRGFTDQNQPSIGPDPLEQRPDVSRFDRVERLGGLPNQSWQ